MLHNKKVGRSITRKPMRKQFIFLVLICIFLTACGGQKDTPSRSPSMAAETIISVTPTATSTSTGTPTATSAPTKIPSSTINPTATYTPLPPYQNKHVIFNYYILGNHSDYDYFYTPDFCCSITKLVIYEDGQIIIAGEKTKQKVLSKDEINQFLSKLDTLGFFSVESNQKHNPTDKLYDYGQNYQKSNDGLKDCILVNGDRTRNLCVRETDLQYLIPKMKSILQYLDKYNPGSMTQYFPDRIFLSVQSADEYADDLPGTTKPWDKNFPSLEITNPRKYALDNNNPVIFIDGDKAKEIYQTFHGIDGCKVFSENDNEFIVCMRVIFPHEKVWNPYQ